MPLRRFRRQFEHLSQFDRRRTIGMMEAGWSARRVAHHLGCSDCVVKWIRDMSFTRRPGSGRLRQTSCREDDHIVRNARVQPTASHRPPSRHRIAVPITCAVLDTHPSTPPLEWCHARGNWTGAERHQVVFSDESRFNLSSDDNSVLVWRPRGKFNLAFALQRHTSPIAGVIVWETIAYNTRSPLVLIYGSMTAQRYVYDIVQPYVLPHMQRSPGAIFQQDNS
ncbi:transposable element Tcb2 transposase [Trichonephila clavipes]|nr:transposable element Tcb2 transposase [Trichonephila clavipes]